MEVTHEAMHRRNTDLPPSVEPILQCPYFAYCLPISGLVYANLAWGGKLQTVQMVHY
jgi:hypothetical protein